MKELEITGTARLVLVDDEDYEKVSDVRWHWNRGYARNRIRGYMHNFLLKQIGVDHKNGNKLDNRRENLRTATQQQNLANQGSRPGSSRFKGVSQHLQSGRWRATITVNHKQISLGLFVTEEAAAEAYNDKAFELYGEYAQLNELEGGQVAREAEKNRS